MKRHLLYTFILASIVICSCSKRTNGPASPPPPPDLYAHIGDDNAVVFAASEGGKLYALDANSGLLKWAKDFPRVFESSPAYYNYKLFITANDGVLYALNAADGSTQWTQGGSGYDWGIDMFFSSSPVVLTKQGKAYHGGISGMKD